MKNFEFSSQICTTKEQSERLLALGLKKETADMWHITTTKDWKGNDIPKEKQKSWISFDGIVLSVGFDQFDRIPAWSLHRLMEIMYNGDMFGFVSLTTHNRNIDTIYELVIANIEGLIKIEKFNKDYLEETK